MEGKALASKTGQVRYSVPGAAGPIGPLVYPAGEYNATTKYIRTALSAPMVLDDGQYYVLNKEGAFTGIRPKDDYAANGSKATWVLMEYVKYAFVEVLMANFAKLASAVFYGDVMMSQQGVDADGKESSNYQGYNTFRLDPDTGESKRLFTPNLLLNFLTGDARLKGDINARTIKLKSYPNTADLKLTDGCFITAGQDFIAPELRPGEVYRVEWGKQRSTKLMEAARLVAQNEHVKIHDGTLLDAYSEFEFDILGSTGVIFGIGSDEDESGVNTNWIVFKLTTEL